MNLDEFIYSTYHKIGVKEMNLVSSYRKGYIGKDTYKVTLNDGTIKTVDQIVKNNNAGDAVIILPITNENKVVAIVESRPFTKKGVNMSFPAGMVDEGESEKQAAIRELREETGYEAEEMIPLEWHYQDVGCSRAVITTFFAKNCTKKYDMSLDGSERLDVVEITYDDVEREMYDMNSDNFKDSGSKIAYSYLLKYRK